MKRWFFIILALVIIAGASIYAYQTLHQIKVGALETIVPDKAIFYLYSYNLDKKITEFQSSQFFQQVSSSEIYKKFIERGLTELRQKFPSEYCLKKDAALAVLSFGDPEGIEEGKNTTAADSLLLLRLEPKLIIMLRKGLTDFYLRSKEGISYKNYNGIKITSYKFPQEDVTVNWVILGDVIIFSRNIYALQESIDLFKQKSQNSLANDASFQKLAPKIEKDSLLWGYCNYKNYNKEIMRVFVDEPSSSKTPKGASLARGASIMKLLNIFEASVFYLDYDILKDGFITKVYGSFNKGADNEELLGIFASQRGVDKKQFNLVPHDIIAYGGSNCDLLNYWKFLKRFLLSVDKLYKYRLANMSFEHTLKMAESLLGVDIEKDILALLSNNQGFAFVNIDSMDIHMGEAGPGIVSSSNKVLSSPFPQFYGFVEFNDGAKLQSVMQNVSERAITNLNKMINDQQQRLASQAKENSQIKPQLEEKEYLKLKVEDYNGTNLYILDILEGFPIEQLRLNYCFLGKYMLISLSPKLTKKIIDLSRSSYGSLNSNIEFGRMMDKMSPDYSSILFLDFGRMIKNMKEAKFFNQIQEHNLKKGDKAFSKETIDEVLDILSNISTFMYTQSLLDSETSEATLYIKVKGL